MSHQHIEGVNKSPRAKGRLYNYIGGKRVKKYIYSPYTAKKNKGYTFYADVKFVKDIAWHTHQAPSHWLTIPVYVGDFNGFREAIESGEVSAKIEIEGKGEPIVQVTYWRNNKESDLDSGTAL